MDIQVKKDNLEFAKQMHKAAKSAVQSYIEEKIDKAAQNWVEGRKERSE